MDEILDAKINGYTVPTEEISVSIPDVEAIIKKKWLDLNTGEIWSSVEYDTPLDDELLAYLRKAMGISGNNEEIPSKTCNSDKNLQELTWQDVKRIWEVGMDVADYNSYHNIPIEDEAFYREVLKRYKEREE